MLFRSSISKGFGQFTLEFKHSGYYMIEVSTTNSFSGSVSSWHGWYSSFRITPYGSKTRWVRVRQYTTTNSGKILVGKWKKKKVTVY